MSAPLTAVFAGLGVEERVARRLERYVHVLLERNTAFNLTGAKDIASAVEHVRDSLRLLPYVREPLIDIGSGGGFPAVPLAIVSGMRITCVESVLKKARFLEEISRLLDLRITVRAIRAEDAARDGNLREAFASATARAVGSVSTVIELTVPFLAVGGLAVLQRGGLSPAERAAAMDAALVLGARVEGEVTLADSRDGEVTRSAGAEPVATPGGATAVEVAPPETVDGEAALTKAPNGRALDDKASDDKAPDYNGPNDKAPYDKAAVTEAAVAEAALAKGALTGGADGKATLAGVGGLSAVGDGEAAVAAPGGEVAQPAIADARCLLLVRKAEVTGQRFPRRAGIPAKRPLCWQGSDA